MADATNSILDYNSEVDPHLRRFFCTSAMQNHMRHAAALDRISARRNPWNDCLEYLMDAGSAYNVGAIFTSNDEFGGRNNKQQHQHRAKSQVASSATAAGTNQFGMRSNAAQHKKMFRPTPPPGVQKQKESSRHHNNGGKAAAPRSNVQVRPQSSGGADKKNGNKTATATTTSGSKMAPLPRFQSALRNIRRFDEEVHRIIVDNSRAESDMREQQRWERMQQRLRVERMIREASSPTMGRRTAGDHERDAQERRRRELELADEDGIEATGYHDQERLMDSKGRFFYPKERGGGTRSLSLSLKSNSNNNNNNSRRSGGGDGGGRGGDEADAIDSDDPLSKALTPTRAERIPGWMSHAVTRFQANCIGWVVRRKLHRAREAATTVQRAFRMHLAHRGVSLAVRILQRAGRAMRTRGRLFLLTERNRLWRDAQDEAQLLHAMCLNLHRAASAVARVPLLEAAARERLELEEVRAEQAMGFAATANDLRRRALLSCVAPKGKLQRENFRRLIDDDDDDEKKNGPPDARAFKPMGIPSALMPALAEIEEDEPKLLSQHPEQQQRQQQQQQPQPKEQKTVAHSTHVVNEQRPPSPGGATSHSSPMGAPALVAPSLAAAAADAAESPRREFGDEDRDAHASPASSHPSALRNADGVDDTMVVVASDDLEEREFAEAKRLSELEQNNTHDVDTTLVPVANGGEEEEDEEL